MQYSGSYLALLLELCLNQGVEFNIRKGGNMFTLIIIGSLTVATAFYFAIFHGKTLLRKNDSSPNEKFFLHCVARKIKQNNPLT
jgi:hypothetical protein